MATNISYSWADIDALALEKVGGNVATDGPFTAAQRLVHAKHALSDVWEAIGGRMTRVAGTDLWSGGASSSAESTKLMDPSYDTTFGSNLIEDIISVWASTNDTSVGTVVGDVPLDRVDVQELLALRGSSGLGSYASPKLYAIVREAVTDATEDTLLKMDRFRLYWYPSVAGFWFPALVSIKAPFPANLTAAVYPDLSPRHAMDVALLMAARFARLMKRDELAAQIEGEASEAVQMLFAKRRGILMSPDQGR